MSKAVTVTSGNLGCMVKRFEGQRNEHEAHDKKIKGKLLAAVDKCLLL